MDSAISVLEVEAGGKDKLLENVDLSSDQEEHSLWDSCYEIQLVFMFCLTFIGFYGWLIPADLSFSSSVCF